MNRNIILTLAYNIVSETEAATSRLYEQNDKRDFEHYIISLDFPIERGDVIPDNFDIAKNNNLGALHRIANQYGSTLLKMINVGVSQNHSSFYNYIKPDDTDVIITCEPDEIQQEGGWVRALAEVLRADETLGYVAPIITDAIPLLANNPLAPIENIAGRDVYIMNGNMNYGQLAMSGRFINKMEAMPYPSNMTIYGGIEVALKDRLLKHGMRWGILKDCTEVHTNIPLLLRQWKDQIIFHQESYGGRQIAFEEWLVLKKWGKS